MPPIAELPVIIAGAGPVGLCGALRLARQGVGCLVVERESALPADLRASTFHPPTLEMLEALDLTGPLLRDGLKVPQWQIRLHETHERAVFDLGVLAADTRHPYRLQFEQARFCALALGLARAEPRLEVRLAAEVTGVQQDDQGVTVTWLEGGVARQARTRYLIAADGAGSTVRRLLGLAFEGETYPETTLLVTTRFPFEEHLPGLSPVSYLWTARGNGALLRLPDRWRVSLYPEAGETAEELITPVRVRAKLAGLVPGAEAHPILEQRAYRIHQRIVASYRAGRVLLAGDAAHINSPTGGMGMNCGIHDAFNLADTLAAVLAGGDPALLDRYDRQRRPVAREEILAQADRNRRRMRTLDPGWRRQELARLQAIAADPAAAREYLLASSMITGLRRAAATP